MTRPATYYGDFFDVDDVKAELRPSYNVAPTDEVYAVAEHDGRRLLGTMRWGLVPHFAKDRKVAARHINARVETVADKPTFRDYFRRRRCIIPADGFFEWERRDDGTKVPHYVYRADREPLAFAGLWAIWRDPETEERLRTCTIITGEPNKLVAPIHDRSPVTLPREHWAAWLDPDEDDVTMLRSLLGAPELELAEHTVSTLVNSVKNNSPELIDAV